MSQYDLIQTNFNVVSDGIKFVQICNQTSRDSFTPSSSDGAARLLPN